MSKIILLFLFASSMLSCQTSTSPVKQEEQESTLVPQSYLGEEVVKNLIKEQNDKAFDQSTSISVSYDPVLKKSKRYEAIPLKPYLERLLKEEKMDTADLQVVFICKDGYAPSMLLSEVLAQQPYLAIRDLDAPKGKMWPDTLNGLWGPFYLVWKESQKETKGLSWPYGLEQIRLVSSTAEFKELFPYGNAAMIPKFHSFKTNCLKCHPMNGKGGIMGPEFNQPKNITEYWSRADIIGFAKNPQSYRANAKMAPLPKISEKELNDIVDYLEFMKGK